MKDYLTTIQKEFERERNEEIAIQQKAYMKGNFEYYGLKSPIRNELQRPFLVKSYLPPKKALHELITILWNKPQREFQYFAQELAFKYSKKWEKDDLKLIEYMIIHKSWWDTVDYIANKLLGSYFKQYPELVEVSVDKWLNSGNIWLQRSCLLFQLKYKGDLNTKLLTHCIEHLLGSKEFFINKAIGWVLREYSRTDPDWVIQFVDTHHLANLSRREALRLMNV